MLDPTAEANGAIRGAAPQDVIFSDRLGEGLYDIILFWPQKLDGLVERFIELQKAIRPEGAIWAVVPKKKYAGQRAIDFTWQELQAAGLQTDLVDNKTASITEEDYGTRFVIRKSRRM